MSPLLPTLTRLDPGTIRDRLYYAGYDGGRKSTIPGTIFSETAVPCYSRDIAVPGGNIFAIFSKDLYEPADLQSAGDEELPDLLYYSDRVANVLRHPGQLASEAPAFPEGPVFVIHLDASGPLHDPTLLGYINQVPQMGVLISTRLKNHHNVLVPPEVMAASKTSEAWSTWLGSINYLPPWVKSPSTTRALLQGLRDIVFRGSGSGSGSQAMSPRDTVLVSGYATREVRAYTTETCPFEFRLEIPEETAAEGADAVREYVEDYINDLDYDKVNGECTLDNWGCDGDWNNYDTDNHELEEGIEFSESDIDRVARAHQG